MLWLFLFFKTIYNMTITRFGFCDIQNNQLEIIGLLRFRQSWTLKNLKVQGLEVSENSKHKEDPNLAVQ